MFNKKAEMGIGTLILFIAMILVAAIAAGVLIQTATSLQSKALLTGSKSQSEVSTSATITYVYGEDSDSNKNLEDTFMQIRLAPGSDPIKFSDVVINVDTKNERNSLVYNSTGLCNETLSDTQFFTEVMLEGGFADEDYLYRGDVVKICFANPEEITEGMDFRITFVPKTGSQSTVDIRAPDVISSERVNLYP